MCAPLDLSHPMTGPCLVQNSPADRVPSHGTWLFATGHALDLVPVDDRGRTAPFRLRSLLRPEAPQAFPGFGAPVLAPIGGHVVRAHDAEPDHPAHRGLPSVGYALTQGRRVSDGWAALAGNHIVLRVGGPGLFLALCHLQKGSVQVTVGDVVGTGGLLARCGNSGNSTEPHLHLQVMDGPDPTAAAAIPFTVHGTLPLSGQIVAWD